VEFLQGYSGIAEVESGLLGHYACHNIPEVLSLVFLFSWTKAYSLPFWHSVVYIVRFGFTFADWILVVYKTISVGKKWTVLSEELAALIFIVEVVQECPHLGLHRHGEADSRVHHLCSLALALLFSLRTEITLWWFLQAVSLYYTQSGLPVFCGEVLLRPYWDVRQCHQGRIVLPPSSWLNRPRRMSHTLMDCFTLKMEAL